MTRIYYHIAAMYGWRAIVMEQLNALARAGWTGELHYCLLAAAEENGFVHRAICHAGMTPVCRGIHADLERYEFPTLEALKADADAGSIANAVYFHTKGASNPGDWVSMLWRWQMNHDLFGTIIPTILAAGGLPDGADTAGSTFTSCDGFSMYSGNFWAATADHIRSLPGIQDYQAICQPTLDGPWRPHWFYSRHPAETWIGHVQHRAHSCDGANAPYWAHNLWAGDVARQDRLHAFHSFYDERNTKLAGDTRLAPHPCLSAGA